MTQPAVDLAAALFESAPVALIYCDDDLRVQSYNRQATLLLPGLTSGLLLTDLLPKLVPGLLAGGQVVEQGNETATRYLSLSSGSLAGQQGHLIAATDVTTSELARHHAEVERAALAATLDNLTDAISLVEPNGDVRYINPSGRLLLGLTPDQPLGDLSRYLASGELHDVTGRLLSPAENPTARALAGEVFPGTDLYIAGPDGGHYVVNISGSSIKNEAGEVQLAITSARDVTATRQIERELAASRDELQAVIDNMAESVLLTNPDGTVCYINRACYKLMGIPNPALAPPFAQFSDFTVINPRYLDGRPMPVTDYPITRSSAGEVYEGFEFLITGLDGLERRISVNGSHLRNEQGQIVRGITSVRDLTDFYQAQQGLRDSRDELLAVLEHMPDSVVLVEPGGSMRYRNIAHRHLLGLDEHGQLSAGLLLTNISLASLDGRTLTPEQYPISRLMAGAKVVNEEMIFYPPDGSTHYVSVGGTSLRDEQGKVRLGIIVTRDITEHRKLEQEMRDNRDQLQALFDNMSDLVMLMEPDGTIRYLNQSVFDLLALSADAQAQMEGANFSTLLDFNLRYPDGQPLSQADMPQVRALRGEVVRSVDCMFTDTVGQDHIISNNVTVIKDEQGNPRLVLTVARDVTPQHKLEQQLHANRDELQAILDNMIEGVILMQPDGTLSYLNRAGRQMLGVEMDEGVGELSDFASLNLEISYPDGRSLPLTQYPLNRAAQGEVFTDSELLFGRANGGRVLLSIGGSAVRDEQGAVRLAINVFRDITSQREIEDQIAQLLVQAEHERQRLLTVIEQLPAGVVVFSAPEGVVLAHNSFSLEMLKLDSVAQFDNGDQATARYLLTYPDGKPLPATEEPVTRAAHGERVINEQWRVQYPDGTSRDLLISAVPIYAADERVFGVATIFQDISDLKELDRLKDEFISITSHELRTPLTTIKGYSLMLARRLRKLELNDADRADFQKPLDTILERTERMVTMVNDLLDVSSLAAGRFEIINQAIDLSAINTSLVEEAQVTYKLPLELHLPDEQVLVLGEGRLIEQVVNNLLSNAAKYSPEGGTITVRVARDDAFAVVSVQDQGIGIPVEQQAHLFERFYRTEHGKHTASGLGLGLYISSSIVQAHGGRMWVESAGEGTGSTFYFTIPLVGQPGLVDVASPGLP